MSLYRCWVLVADLVGSRQVAERAVLAERLEKALGELPARTGSEAWIAPLTSVRGIDELSAVLRRPGPAAAAKLLLDVALWPHGFRFALALGDIDVGLDTGRAEAMDGPAFHRAADALERARAERRSFALAVETWPREVARAVEAAVALQDAVVGAWTETRARVVQVALRLRELRGAGRGLQSALALELGVKQPTVSQHLAKAHWREIETLLESLPAGLDRLAETYDHRAQESRG